MSRMLKTNLAVAAMLAATGCTWQQVREEVPFLRQETKPVAAQAAKTSSSVAMAALRYYHQLGALTPEQLRAEWDEAKRQFDKDRDEVSRLRLAMLALRPGIEQQNPALAAELLRDYRDKASVGENGDALGAFMLDVALEQVKLVEQKRAANVQLEKVQEQINALKDIEQSIHQREIREGGTKKR